MPQDSWTVQTPEDDKLLDLLYGEVVETTDDVITEEVITEKDKANAEAYDSLFAVGDEEETEEPVEDETEETEEAPAEQKPAKKVGRPKAPEEAPVDGDLLKAGAEFIAEKLGIELPDDIESWDTENFPEFLQEAIDYKVNERYTALRESDPVGEAILEVLENGGNHEAIIDLFREQKKFNAIDGSTPEGKIEKIRKYYTEIAGKSLDWTNKRIIEPISTAEDTSALEEEYEEVSGKYDEYIQLEKQLHIDTAKAQKATRERFVATQRTNFAKTLEASKFKKQDIAAFTDYVYNDEALTITATGERVSQFDWAIRKAKVNPAELTDLTLFLKDKEAYNKKVITEATNKKVENSFAAKFVQQKTTKGGERQTEAPKQKPKFQF